MSRVDVIIPCYNYARYLPSCVQSVLSQSMRDVRVLIIDDASTDDSSEVAGSLAASDPRVHLERHAVNLGHIATYNEGLDWVESEYLILLSADDMLTPGSLARAVEMLDEEPRVGFVYGRGISFQGDVPPARPINASANRRVVQGTDFLRAVCGEGDNPVCTPTVMARAAIQRKVGGYRPELPHSGDMEMWMRFAAHSDVGYLEAEQAYYRLHRENMSLLYFEVLETNSWIPSLGDLQQRTAAFEALFREYGSSLVDGDLLRDASRRAMAWTSFWAASAAFDRSETAGCDDLLGFATEVWPGIRDRPEWERLRWKRRVGPGFWKSIRPLVRHLRPRRVHPSSAILNVSYSDRSKVVHGESV